MGEAGGGLFYPDSAGDEESEFCRRCPFPASCSEFGRCPLDRPAGPGFWSSGPSLVELDAYGDFAPERADSPCCEHCDHDPGLRHAGACITCEFDLPDYDRQ